MYAIYYIFVCVTSTLCINITSIILSIRGSTTPKLIQIS